MSEEAIIVADAPGSEDNLVLPFQIEAQNVRGRAIRLGTSVDQVLESRDYPEDIAALMGEILALTGLLGSIMKFDGKLTLQAKADGAIKLMVADYESPGKVRGYAQVDQEKYDALPEDPSLYDIFGKGYLAMTMDQGADMERYQGIVELSGDSIAECAQAYFKTSEQTPTRLHLSAGRDPVTNRWRAGGLMIQHLAHGEEGGPRLMAKEEENIWEHLKVLTQTIRPEELRDPQLTLKTLLYRLYHEDGVRIFDPVSISRNCKCSVDYLLNVLKSFSPDQQEEMVEDGKISVNCAFCNKDFFFTLDDLQKA